MNNGEIIKYYRNKKGLSQEKLSQGIVTTAHLQNIEEDLVKPSTNHLELFAKKLKVDKKLFHPSTDNLIEEKLFSCYDSTVTQNKKEAGEKLSYINSKYKVGITTSIQSDTFLLYLLVKLKYFLLMNDRKVIDVIYTQIKTFPVSMNPKIEYIRNKTLGIYFYRSNNLLQSNLALFDAVKISNILLHLKEADKAELYYQVALTQLKTSESFDSVTYAEKALHLYNTLTYSKRAAECHIILGINYRRKKQYDLAESSYLAAKSIGEKINDQYLESMALQNIGCIKSDIGESEEAIYCFLESLKMKKAEDRSLFCIHSLVKEYYKLGQYHFSKDWAEQGLSLAKRNSVNEYIMHFTVYLYLIDKDRQIESYVSNVMKYFREAGNEEYVIRYAKLLANYYYQLEEYKLACEYYEMSFQALKQKSSVL